MSGRPWMVLEGPSGSLMAHATGNGSAGANSGVAVVVHDFPLDFGGAERVAPGLLALADRLAEESGWRMLAGCLRGVGESTGDFSPLGWMEDLAVLVERGVEMAGGVGVWMVGLGVGGSLALCHAATDGRIRGVGCLASPANLADWGSDPASMLDAARRVGVVRSAAFPADVAEWAHQFNELRPLECAAQMASRGLLVVHGADDDDVPVSHSRHLVEAAGRSAELRVLPGAGHRLRADPRAMAVLAGWLERQGP